MFERTLEALNIHCHIRKLLCGREKWRNTAISFACITGLAFSSVAFGARSVSQLPVRVNFDNNNYGDVVKLSAGATHVWDSSGGWSGGAAKFTPPNQNEGYSGIGSFTGLDSNIGNIRHINVRFLIKHGPTFHNFAANNKLVIINRTVGLRPMIISKSYYNWRTYRPCHNTWCVPGVTADEELKIGPDPGSRINEWISVELETDLDRQVINLYIYTADGQISGLYQVNPFVDPNDSGEGIFSYLDIVGGYFGSNFVGSDPGNYFLIDELVIDDQYIGPPSGFVGSATAPPAPPANIQ